MNRRHFISGLLAVPASVAAVKLGALASQGDEIREALLHDLDSPIFTMPKVSFESRPLWRSNPALEKYWIDELSKDLAPKHKSHIPNMVRRLVREIENDAKVSEIADNVPMLVEVPRLSASVVDGIQIAAGIQQYTNILGETKYKIGFIRPDRLVNQFGIEL